MSDPGDRAGAPEPCAALDRLFDVPVIGRRYDPDHATPEALYPDERAQVSRAAPRRQREFAAGRLAARDALATCGAPPGPLLTGTDRVPLWPAGFVGSISHARAYCVAVVARRADAHGVGVDVEALDRVTPAVWRHIFTPDEIEALNARPEADSLLATIAFSAKESLFKCQYAVRRGWLGFHDCTVEVRGSPSACGELELTFLRDARADHADGVSFHRGAVLRGRYVTDGSHVLTGVLLGTR